MAEALQKILEKKVLSSSSEEVSPPIRSHLLLLSARLPAMSANLYSKLEAILSKLKKLDAIEKSVKGQQETLAQMDDRIDATSNQDINDLKDSPSFAEDQPRITTESFDKYKEQTNLKRTAFSKKKIINWMAKSKS